MNKGINVRPFINGSFQESKTDKWMDAFNPSTGEKIAHVPCCTEEELELAVSTAKEAYKGWSETPVQKRVKVLYSLRDLLNEHLEELTMLVATENGKAWKEAEGDVAKAIEATEHAISAPSLLMGESLLDTSKGYDTVSYKTPVGVFAGIVPFNFPAMIPMGWMTPMCIVSGNCIVIKAASAVPQSALRIAELYKEAGLPDGVLNVITCDNEVAEKLLTHPDIAGVSFVGSSKVGRHVYSVASAAGKRVQVLGEAKNHALVMRDAPLKRTVAGIINSAFGCAGERCMALPVVVVEDVIADELIKELKEQASHITVGPAYDKKTKLGPVISATHKERVESWIQKGIDEGATLVLDGRNTVVEGFENGYYIGPTIFDNVSAEMEIGQREIFGPVLCVKRVKDFDEGLEVMNANSFANGSVIYTGSGYYSREFVKRTDGGMIGINVGIPVPVSMFPFNGKKNSFFGSLHTLGKDGIRFYTENKVVTTTWFDEVEGQSKKVSTWDGSL